MTLHKLRLLHYRKMMAQIKAAIIDDVLDPLEKRTDCDIYYDCITACTTLLTCISSLESFVKIYY